MQHDLPDLVGVPNDPQDGVGGLNLAVRPLHWEPPPFAFVDLTPLIAEWLGVTEAALRAWCERTESWE